MADARTCGIVWSTTPEHAAHLLGLDQDSFHHCLADAFEHVLGEVTGSGTRRAFPLRRAHAERYCRERFVLVGDAAHVVHPLAGMGANLGLLDAATLAEIVESARGAQRDIGLMQTLRCYERWRRSENAIMLRLLDGIGRIYGVGAGPLPRLRRAGMDLLDACAPLKRLIMRRASGLEGDVPALVRGTALTE
jgi:2-octaprenylphenol hydroxylase